MNIDDWQRFKLYFLLFVLLVFIILYIIHTINYVRIRRNFSRINTDFPDSLSLRLHPIYFSLPSNYFGGFQEKMSFSGVGYIEPQRNGFRIYGRHMNGRGFLREYSTRDSKVHWIGRNLRYGGNVCWFKVSRDGKELYISRFTGYTNIGSKRLTKEVFREIRLLYDNQRNVRRRQFDRYR